MSNRTAESYLAVFEYIEKNVFQLEPASLMTDWELGMRKALSLCYPRCILRGCWFHYCKSLRKKFIKLGLASLLKADDFAKKISQQFMSLPLLPKEHFEAGLSYIKLSIPGYQLSASFRNFLAHFNFWIRQVCKYNDMTRLSLFSLYGFLILTKNLIFFGFSLNFFSLLIRTNTMQFRFQA